MQARVVILNETFIDTGGGWRLCFQYCRYEYGNGTEQNGYRFIWRKPNTGHLQGARGQARIPSTSILLKLVSQAIEAGWGHFDGDTLGFLDDVESEREVCQ